jgi:VanZ family protein
LGARATPVGIPVFISYWLPPALWCAGVLVLSGDWGSAQNTLGLVQWLLSWIPALSPAQIEVIHGYCRKSAHVLGYGVLCFLWFRAFQGNLGYRAKRAALWSLGLSLVVALVDEGHQSFLQSRTASLRDVGLDFLGLFLAAWFTAAFWRPRSGPGPGSGTGATPGANG